LRCDHLLRVSKDAALGIGVDMTQATNGDCKVCGGLDIELELANALMANFCRALEGSNLTPMQVLQMMARSLGGIYREVSTEHRKAHCPCGWCPDGLVDLELIHRAIGAGAARTRQADLRSMSVAGCA
jgi:hypothetical protein